MNMDELDKKIQESLDSNRQYDDTSEDAKAYLALYAALDDSKQENYLSSSFADKVVSKVMPKRDYAALWWFGSAIMIMSIAGLVVTVMMLGIMNIDAANFFSKYFPIMVLTTLIMGVIQYLDNRIEKKLLIDPIIW